MVAFTINIPPIVAYIYQHHGSYGIYIYVCVKHLFAPSSGQHFSDHLQAPPFTHWTGTTVDYPYVRSSAKWRVGVDGVYIVNSHLSRGDGKLGLVGKKNMNCG